MQAVSSPPNVIVAAGNAAKRLAAHAFGEARLDCGATLAAHRIWEPLAAPVACNRKGRAGVSCQAPRVSAATRVCTCTDTCLAVHASGAAAPPSSQPAAALLAPRRWAQLHGASSPRLRRPACQNCHPVCQCPPPPVTTGRHLGATPAPRVPLRMWRRHRRPARPVLMAFRASPWLRAPGCLCFRCSHGRSCSPQRSWPSSCKASASTGASSRWQGAVWHHTQQGVPCQPHRPLSRLPPHLTTPSRLRASLPQVQALLPPCAGLPLLLLTPGAVGAPQRPRFLLSPRPEKRG